MPEGFDPRIDLLPPPQREIWPQLGPAPELSFVLYGGTAVALHLGHRVSIDFDFFSATPLEKAKIEARFQFVANARTIQEDENTLVLDAVGPRQNIVLWRHRAGPDQRSASNQGQGASCCFA